MPLPDGGRENSGSSRRSRWLDTSNNPIASSRGLGGRRVQDRRHGYRARGAIIRLCGRKKDLFIVGGVNIVPHDHRGRGVGGARRASGRVSDVRNSTQHTQTDVQRSWPSRYRDRTSSTGAAARSSAVAAQFQITSVGVYLVPPGWLVKSSSGKMARRANREKWAARVA